MSPLISASELQIALATGQVAVVDCRHDLNDREAGRRAYAEGHVPGAVFMQLDEDLSGSKSGRNGRHPLPEANALALRLAQLGIGDGTQVIAYDGNGGMFAARLWWLLRWLGHDAVQVLDGGLTAWQAGGGALDSVVPASIATTFTPRQRDAAKVTLAEVAHNLAQPTFQLVDARAASRFAGIDETLDPVAGHIEGAANRFFQLNLQTDGRFKPAAALRAEWAVLLGDTPVSDTVHQCGSGVTACHNLLALEVAGMTGGRLYPGSWSEWVGNGYPAAHT